MQTCSSCKRGLDRFGRLLPRPNVNINFIETL